ncbi:MAG: hypothetical protein IKB03_00500 [Tidjanibacter sp.]|nr:hypothetical protein [Tidjanibacter sp.]
MLKQNNYLSYNMKKLFVLLFCVGFIWESYAQNVYDFEVGPYEVEVVHKGEWDHKFRLRQDVDLYDYYGLKRDTIVVSNEQEKRMITNALQVDVAAGLPYSAMLGNSTVIGVDGLWKHLIASDCLYLNAGLSVDVLVGKYGPALNYHKETLMEIGVPVAVEWAKLDKRNASLFVSAGLAPTLYTILNAKELIDGEYQRMVSDAGMLLIPKVEVGGYLPVGGYLVRMAASGEYKINCTGGGYDIYRKRIARAFVGVSIGLIF